MSKLLPYRSYDERDVLNRFSTVEATLEAGTLVSISSFDPTKEEAVIETDTVNMGSASYVVNPHYVNAYYKVQTATSGVMKYAINGMTLKDVKSVDELNRNLFYNPQKRTELDCAFSGESIPIVTRGEFAISDQAYVGTPGVNKLLTVGANGKFEFVTYAELTGKGMTMDYVIGKCLSKSGACGGYERDGNSAFIFLDL